jgi:pimeloyl-ACP methyl ester carboxylesterase
MPRTARAVLVALLACAVAVGPAIAQPGFGPPKRKPRPEGDQPAQEPQPGAPRAPAPNPPSRKKPFPGEPETPDWIDSDPERQDPSAKAKPGVWYAAKTADGLRYAWSLPEGFEAGKAYDVVVLLHPANANFRWGPANHARGEGTPFCPGDILVCVDAMGVRGSSTDARFYEPTPENAVRFRDTLLETTRQLPTRHIVLYGQGSGGTFAMYFAAAFPALADGVLAHGAPLAEHTAIKSTVPIVLMHGAKDPGTPLAKSVEALEEYRAVDHPSVRLRVLRGLNDFPNPVRAGECIDYLHAVRTDNPADALAAVRRMLRPKGVDDFGYRSPVWYAGAAAALSRFGAEKPGFDPAPTPEQTRDAEALLAALDAEAARHVARARELLKPQRDPTALVLDGGPWLGYLGALRDDLRGLPAAEAFARELKLDEQLGAQRKPAEELISGWAETGGDALRYEQAVTLVPKCFLVEWLPVDMPSRCKACLRKADELEIPQDLRDKGEFITLYEKGWREGVEAFGKDARAWKLPEPPAPVDASPKK